MSDVLKEIEQHIKEGADMVGGVLYKAGAEIGRWVEGVFRFHEKVDVPAAAAGDPTPPPVADTPQPEPAPEAAPVVAEVTSEVTAESTAKPSVADRLGD